MYDDKGGTVHSHRSSIWFPEIINFGHSVLARFNDIVYYAQIFDDQCKTFPRAP